MTEITKKQYILSSTKLELPELCEYKLEKCYLYADGRLNVKKYAVGDKKEAYLIGNAFCMDKPDKSIEEDIRFLNEKSVDEITKYWTGRWILIYENELITDACGLMSAFCTKFGNRFCVSSSLGVLCDITGLNLSYDVKSGDLGWYIAPNTTVEGVYKLLATQKIIFSENDFKTVSYMPFEDTRFLSTGEKCEKLAAMLVNGMKNIYEYGGKNIWSALTGGKDSRLALAALLKSEIPFSCYTADHENISGSDKKVPPQLAEKFGIPYMFVKRGKTDKNLLADYDNFTLKNIDGADKMFYARGRFSKIPRNAVVIRSGIFEAAQNYARTTAGNTPKTFADGMKNYYKELENSEKQQKALSTWLETVKENPAEYIDIRDRFYIEQRVGVWTAAIEQSLDMNDFVSVQIANCAAFISILICADERERKEIALSYGTMKILDERVLELKINAKCFYDRVRRLKDIIKHPSEKIKKYFHKKKYRG